MASSLECISVYTDAVSALDEAATECGKTWNVDLSVILSNIERCLGNIERVQTIETLPIRQDALKQLETTLRHQIKIIKTKIKQLDGARISGTPTKDKDKKFLKSPHKTVTEEPSEGSSSECAEPSGAGSGAQDGHTRARKLAIEDTIVKKSSVGFSDVAGLVQAKQSLKEAIIMPVLFPHFFTGGRKPWNRILLYGPPGTGKSRLAQAVSSEIQSTFYSVSSADLVSSWVGESEKLIKELFANARKQKGRTVIFLDEIDSICRRRSSREEEHTRRIKTELLKQMEGSHTSGESIFFLAATNCPWEIDTAFLRRFQKRIYIPLPDREARLSLMKMHCRGTSNCLSNDDWGKLAVETEGCSGSDLATLVMDALIQPVRDLQTATHWKHEGNKVKPCMSDEQGAFESDVSDIPKEKVHLRDIALDDFLRSASGHSKTVTEGELLRFEEFTNSFGQNG